MRYPTWRVSFVIVAAITSLFLSSISFAEPVNPAEVRTAADAFLRVHAARKTRTTGSSIAAAGGAARVDFAAVGLREVRDDAGVLLAYVVDVQPRGFVALSADTARWLVARGVRLVGVDYLSVGSFGQTRPTHRALLGAGVICLEGLNLSGIAPGLYQLVCLPLRIAGIEGAPARAVLIG